MTIMIIGLLIGLLIGAGLCLYKIYKIQQVYATVWGSDVSTQAWGRKAGAFVCIAFAQCLGVASVLLKTTHWSVTVIYFGLMNLSLLGFYDSYRILLTDLKRLPQKRK